MKLKIFGLAADLRSPVLELLRGKFRTANIDAHISSGSNDLTISFGDNQLFSSIKDNKIPLNKTDPRIRKMGRSYLISRRPTKEQWEAGVDALTGAFTRLNITASVALYGKEGALLELWRDSSINLAIEHIPKSFPIQGDVK